MSSYNQIVCSPPPPHPKKTLERVMLSQKAERTISHGDIILRRGWDLLSRMNGVIQFLDMALETLLSGFH